MTQSKAWKWEMIQKGTEGIWKEPSMESYYLVDRWKKKGFKKFLDLGCGLGRHSVQFGHAGFDVSCFDISSDAIERTKEWAGEEGLSFSCATGDMLSLPYDDDSIDCILCMNVISHTDTEGVKKAISQIHRVLKRGGEIYLTLAAKDTHGFTREDWPLIDENTRMRMEPGPEYMVPHFYADFDQTRELFEKFNIHMTHKVHDYYYMENGNLAAPVHYHLLLEKK